MTNDSNLFWKREELEKEGAYPVAGSHWRKGNAEWAPLMEGKSIEQYNHRYASIRFNPKNVSGQGVAIETLAAELEDPAYAPSPRYWVSCDAIKKIDSRKWTVAFRDITNVNNWRTVIASLIPVVALGNKLPFYVTSDSGDHLVRLCSNLNAFVLDYVARLKIQSRNLNAYIAEQLPVLTPEHYTRRFGQRTAADIVRDHVLRLTYTAHDMAPFARDMDYLDADGTVKPPIIWDEAERRHLRARLDALYFILYGVTDEDDIRYILSTFPIVARKDREAFEGVYLTAELILWYKRALDAGDPDARAPEADLIRLAKARA